MRLNGARIGRNLDCEGAKFRHRTGYSLSAAGAHIAGSLYLCKTKEWGSYPSDIPLTSEGTVRLEGAQIAGDLDCTGGLFQARAFLEADWNPKKKDSQYDLDAIKADNLDVQADLLLGDGFESKGIVSLIGARVGGDMQCSGASFHFPGEEPLIADGINVSGTTFLTDDVRTNGILSFVQANFGQGLEIIGAIFDTVPKCMDWLKDGSTSGEPLHGPACGIYAPLAKVNGNFIWQDNTKLPADGKGKNLLWLYLAGTVADFVEDDEFSWTMTDRFDVTECEYDHIEKLGGSFGWRLGELDRQYAILNPKRPADGTSTIPQRIGLLLQRRRIDAWALGRALWRACVGEEREGKDKNKTGAAGTDDKGGERPRDSGKAEKSVSYAEAVERFTPQPYIQLARIAQAAGYEVAASDILIQLERNKTRYSDFGVFRQIARWILDLGLCFGFSPFRPIWILLGWALFSAVVFQNAFENQQFKPTHDNVQTFVHADGTQQTVPAVPFNALFYAVDSLVPFIDLNQKKSWTVQSSGEAQTSNIQPDWMSGIGAVWADRPDWGAPALIVFNTFFGWLMTTLFAAGVTGLLRSGKEDAQ